MATPSAAYLFKHVNMVLRIFKMIANGSFLAALECTEFVFGRGLCQEPRLGRLQRSPDPLAGLRGPTSKGERTGEREGKRGEGEKEEIKGPPP